MPVLWRYTDEKEWPDGVVLEHMTEILSGYSRPHFWAAIFGFIVGLPLEVGLNFVIASLGYTPDSVLIAPIALSILSVAFVADEGATA